MIVSKKKSLAFCICVLISMQLSPPSQAQEQKIILWYGNSFTNATCCGSTRQVPSVVADIAVAAGEIAPLNRNVSANGRSMQWHLDNNTAVIAGGIPAGEFWDHVVLQDLSTMPTTLGNLPQHLSSTLGMYQAVAAHSPLVEPIMYETWARGFGHPFYTGTPPAFPGGPAQMQQQLRDGYMMSTQNINMNAGADVARYAPVGDAWELGGWPANFYGDVNYHAGNRGTLLNALVLYGTIFEDVTTSDIDLTRVLTSLNLTPADGLLVTSLADAVLVPEPSSMLLLVGSGCLLAWMRRRPRRKTGFSLPS